MKKILLILLASACLGGCSTPVRNTVSDEFVRTRPQKIAIMPVFWEGEADKDANAISLLFRNLSAEKLSGLNYRTVSLEDIQKTGADPGRDWYSRRPAQEITGPLKADSVLYIHLKSWDRTKLLTYGALKISAEFELRSAAGKLLWSADYSTKESDLSLDGTQMELALHKAYEPRIQRFVDAVFTRFPEGAAQEAPKKSYFQWLP